MERIKALDICNIKKPLTPTNKQEIFKKNVGMDPWGLFVHLCRREKGEIKGVDQRIENLHPSLWIIIWIHFLVRVIAVLMVFLVLANQTKNLFM